MKAFGWGIVALGLMVAACAPQDEVPASGETPPVAGDTAEVVPAEVSRGADEAPVLQAAGEMCGGIAALQCAEGLYCHMEPGVCISVADAAGECREIPMMCTREYMPVKGCDGKKYANKCEANANGTSVAEPWTEGDETVSEESTGE